MIYVIYILAIIVCVVGFAMLIKNTQQGDEEAEFILSLINNKPRGSDHMRKARQLRRKNRRGL